jgi:outer membrane protein assembly factor BamB
VLLALAFAAAEGLAAGSPNQDWTRYGSDNQQTNYRPAAAFAGLTPASAKRLRAAWRVSVDGGIVASPLYAASLRIGTKKRDVLYVGTEAGSVYALDAATGRTLWRRRLGAVKTPCGISYGISSTGVLDRSRNRLFVIGATGLLHALDMRTGKELSGWPLRLSAHQDAEYVWGGLTINPKVGLLYVPFATYCDLAGADGYRGDGRLVAIDVAHPRVAATLDVVPGVQNMGGIWGYGGTSIDPIDGVLWTATGNAANNGKDATPEGERVVELDPRTLSVIAGNHPPAIDKYDDGDFGSTPTLFEPPGCAPLAAAYAKNGVMYVWRRSALASDPAWSVKIGAAGAGASPFVGEPSYSPAEHTLYVSDALWTAADGTKIQGVAAFRIRAGCAFPAAPTWATKLGTGVKAPGLVVGAVLFVTGGDTRRFYALDVRSGKILWGASLNGSGYSSPILAGSQVVVGTYRGQVSAFSLPRR